MHTCTPLARCSSTLTSDRGMGHCCLNCCLNCSSQCVDTHIAVEGTASGTAQAKPLYCYNTTHPACVLLVLLLLQAIAARYGVLLEKAGIALRGLFIINPEGVIQQITINDLVSLKSWS